MKSCRHWKLLAAALLALATTDVTAQDQGRAHAFRTGGDSPNDPTYLLAAESVQKELLLTGSQKASLKKLREEDNNKHPFSGGLVGLSQTEIQKKLDQHAEESRKGAAKILTPLQMERLNEINIQVVGVTALGFDDVAEKLKLTAEQKAKLKSVTDEARRKQAALNTPNNGWPVEESKRQDYKQRLNYITTERKNQAIAVLTDEQRAKFTKLQGEKFDTSMIQPAHRNFSSRGRIESPARKSSTP